MAYVIIEDDQVVGIFHMPQPHLEGYQEIPDEDTRIADYLESQEAP